MTEPDGPAGAAGATGHGPTVVVVGGGITGLAAAWQLVRSPLRPRVVLLEAGPRLGGKILTGEIARQRVELGPDAFLARVPQAVDLCTELGLDSELVSPATGHAYVWSRGHLRRLPAGLVLGVPSDLVAVARSGIVRPAGLARAALDLVLPAESRAGAGAAGPDRSPGPDGSAGPDRSVGDIVTARFGRQVQERLVDPLVGGINAGRSELLSARATVPQLDAAANSGRSLLLALRRQVAAAAAGRPEGPVFLTHPDGLGRVVEELARRLSTAGADVRTSTPVTSLERAGNGWTVGIGPAGTALPADGVVVCAPAPAAAALLDASCPDAAVELGAIEHASVAVATFAYPPEALSRPLDGSGFLVPRPEGRLMTAATFMSVKWAHLARPDPIIVRVSAGRHRDDRAMRLSDDELARALHAELAQAVGLTREPVEASITRWPDGFPQYLVGHLDRVARIEQAVARVPGLAVAGCAYRGVGIPACTGQGRDAAARVLAAVGSGVTA